MYDRLLKILSEGQGEMFGGTPKPSKPPRGRKSTKESPGLESAELGAGEEHQERLKTAEEEAERAKKLKRVRDAVRRARGGPNANLT